MMETPAEQTENRMSWRWLLVAGTALVLAVAIFAGGFFAGSQYAASGIANNGVEVPSLPLLPAQQDATPPPSVDMSTFWEVWNTLDSRFYYGVPTEQDRVEGAINGLINSLGDPYTAYVNPDVAKILQEDSSGEFEGIGAYVEEAPEGGVYIIRVFDGGPADNAGLQSGDVVIAVDGKDVTQQTLRESLLLIRGPAGTDVTLTILRHDDQSGQTVDLTVTRAHLDIPTVDEKMLDNNIGYVALFEFNARSSARLRSAVQDLIDQGAQSLILDLRDNPGGYLDESVAIADTFLPKGTVLIQRDVDGKERTYTSRNGDFAEDIPMVVLINGNSASASEIVAAAIHDNGRGTLIGEKSFGKGSVQIQYNLSDGSMLRVTYALWFTPADVSISENGIEPDIHVDIPADLPADQDPILDRAIQFLTTGQ